MVFISKRAELIIFYLLKANQTYKIYLLWPEVVFVQDSYFESTLELWIIVKPEDSWEIINSYISKNIWFLFSAF